MGRKERRERQERKRTATSPARGGPAVPPGGGTAAAPPPSLPPATSGGATKVSGRRWGCGCGWSGQETVAPATGLAGTSAGAGACPRQGGCSWVCPPGREGGGDGSGKQKVRVGVASCMRGLRGPGDAHWRPPLPACPARARCTLGCVVLWAGGMQRRLPERNLWNSGWRLTLPRAAKRDFACLPTQPHRRPSQPSVAPCKIREEC